jgi:hypothetical protein
MLVAYQMTAQPLVLAGTYFVLKPVALTSAPLVLASMPHPLAPIALTVQPLTLVSTSFTLAPITLTAGTLALQGTAAPPQAAQPAHINPSTVPVVRPPARPAGGPPP